MLLAPALRLPRPLAAPRRREGVAVAVALVAAALFLFADAAPAPIALWDESRTIVNALEMHRDGWGLVTTFGGRPDLWNTKPPLLIWLMSGSVQLFGPSEAALRLPSTVAALGTMLVVILFSRRVTGSLATALVAAGLLVLSPGFFGEHGARTADYDALLTFFTTGYLALLFLAAHTPRPGRLLAAAAALAGAAVLTKSVAGLVPGVAVPVYLVAVGRAGRAWRTSAWWRAAAAVIAVGAVWYLLRETAGAGYARAAWANDVANRYAGSVVGAPKPASFYLTQLAHGFFAATPLLLLAPAALPLARGRARLLLGYSLAVSAAVLAAYSEAGSKLSHYILPALPFMAIAVAVAGRAAVQRIVRASGRVGPATIGCLVVAALVGGQAGREAWYARYEGYPAAELTGEGRYGPLLATLAPGGAAVTAVEPGFTLERWPHYAAVLEAYRLLWAARGVRVDRRLSLDGAQRGLVASCDAGVVRTLGRRGDDIRGAAGCAAVRLR